MTSGGPSGVADWSARWSDDSETGGFYGNDQSEASCAFVSSAAVTGPCGGRDGVVQSFRHTRVFHPAFALSHTVTLMSTIGNVLEALGQINCGLKYYYI